MQTCDDEEEEAVDVDDGDSADETSDASGRGKTAWTPAVPIKALTRRRATEKRIFTFLYTLSFRISFASAYSLTLVSSQKLRDGSS